MEILELSEEDKPVIDEYTLQAPNALPFHLAGWKEVLQQTYGHPMYYLAAREGGRIEGLLPLMEVRSWLLGHSLTSLPGGICTSSETVAVDLLARAEQLARCRRLDRLVLRDSRQRWPGKLDTQSDFVAYKVELVEDSDALWKGLHKNVRRQVRMARRNGVTVKISREPDAVNEFYRVFSTFTRRMGTPVFGRDFLHRVVDTFHKQFEIALAYYEGAVVGAYLQQQLRGTVFGMWGASLPAYLGLRPNYLIYWEIMRHAAEQGYRYLDMGRSRRGSGTSNFKKQWGGEAHPVYRQYLSLQDFKTTADVSERVQITRWFQLFTQVWCRLPLPLTVFLGARMRRHLPFA